MWLRVLFTLISRVIRLEKTMSDLSDVVASLQTEVANLKARVTAHEQKDADTVAALQAQIDALKSEGADVPAAVTALQAVVDDIKGFDPAPAA